MSDKVQIEQTQLQELLSAVRSLTAEVNDLKKNGPAGGTLMAKKIKDRKVKILFVDGSPVVGFKNVGIETAPVYVFDEPDPMDKNKVVQSVIIITKDADGKLKENKVNYTEFLKHAETRSCLIKSFKENADEVEYGFTSKKDVEDYRTLESDVMVPLTVTEKRRIYSVDIGRNGVEDILEIDEKYVNMK